MQIQPKCLVCTLHNFISRLERSKVPDTDKEKQIRSFLQYLSTVDMRQCPPQLGRGIHQHIRSLVNDPDPYKDEKHYYNQTLLSQYSGFKKQVEKADDPMDAAIQLAVVGNIIDFGTQHEFDFNEVIKQAETASFVIDHRDRLKHALEDAEKILYLGDNCGEIVFDKLLLETLQHTYLNKTWIYAVRGAPIINDATIEDAEFVGIPDYAHVIHNGYDAPGTILEHSSEEFKEWFDRADIIISKGQGNFEGLSDHPGPLFFMLMAKCNVVGEHLGVPRGSMVVLDNHALD